VNRLAPGRSPTPFAPWLCGAPLTSLAKPNGEARPIAVGEIIRRLVAKRLMARVSQPAQALLTPLQLGVAFEGRSEAIVHTVGWLITHHLDTAVSPDWAVFTLSQVHALLLAVTYKPSLQLKPAEFRQATRYRLGIADHNEEQVGPVCRKCRPAQDPQDAGFVYGDHSTQCHGAGSLHRRHDRLKVVLYAALRSGGVRVYNWKRIVRAEGYELTRAWRPVVVSRSLKISSGRA
jgi:hypothetical protein